MISRFNLRWKFLNLKSTALRFLLKSFFWYFILFLFYQFILVPYTSFDQWVIRLLIKCSEILLLAFGPTFSSLQNTEMQVLGLDGSTGVWIGVPCNGISLMGLFSVFILAYPGKTTHKILFITSGLILIFIYNCLRICALAYLSKYHPAWLMFNHTYTFTATAYLMVFGLWMLWIKRFSPGHE